MKSKKKYTTTKLPACLADVESPEDAAIRILRARLAASEARAERLAKSLKEIIDDLETRSDWKEGTQKGVVDIGQGVYLRGKAALAEGDGKS